MAQCLLLLGWGLEREHNLGERGCLRLILLVSVLHRLPSSEGGAEGVLRGVEGDGGELSRGGWGTSCEGDAVRGAACNLGDAVVLEAVDELRFLVTDGAAIALLAMLVVSPGIHLWE